ncbi:hypothetical protein ACFLS8_01610 [Chloroflexota bacterium]
MKRRLRYKPTIYVLFTFLFLILTLILLTMPGCALISRNQVNIYLIQDEDAYKDEPNRMLMFSLEPTPIISNSDIVTYDSEQHQIELKSSAFEKLKNIDVPVNGGRSFIVCVGIVRVYMGAFWSPLSSSSSEEVIIQQPLSDESNLITIQLGYPNESFFRENDPRSDTRITQALRNTGKLK